MMNLELHVLRNWDDANLAEKAGVIAFDEDVSERCAHCETFVGPRGDYFAQCVVVLEDDDEDDMYYLVCLPCATPIVDPGN